MIFPRRELYGSFTETAVRDTPRSLVFFSRNSPSTGGYSGMVAVYPRPGNSCTYPALPHIFSVGLRSASRFISSSLQLTWPTPTSRPPRCPPLRPSFTCRKPSPIPRRPPSSTSSATSSSPCPSPQRPPPPPPPQLHSTAMAALAPPAPPASSTRASATSRTPQSSANPTARKCAPQTSATPTASASAASTPTPQSP